MFNVAIITPFLLRNEKTNCRNKCVSVYHLSSSTCIFGVPGLEQQPWQQRRSIYRPFYFGMKKPVVGISVCLFSKFLLSAFFHMYNQYIIRYIEQIQWQQRRCDRLGLTLWKKTLGLKWDEYWRFHRNDQILIAPSFLPFKLQCEFYTLTETIHKVYLIGYTF